MIDILRDYAAIGAGSAYVAGVGAMAAGRARAEATLTWGAATAADFQDDPKAAAAQSTAAAISALRESLDRASRWLTLVPVGPTHVLSFPMPRLVVPHLSSRRAS